MSWMKNLCNKNCVKCGVVFIAYRPAQKYCKKCGEENGKEIKRKSWAKKYPNYKDGILKRLKSNVSAARLRGIKKSVDNKFDEDFEIVPKLVWKVRIKYPFTYDLSKNSIWRNTGRGYVFLRAESRKAKEEIGRLLLAKIKENNIKIARNKIWLKLLVEKPNHRGDAINVVDLVSDAIKEVVGVDDRWFSFRGIDWRVVKENPEICIEIGQESLIDAQVCSYCGRILSLEHFSRHRTATLGYGRECKECVRKS